MTQLPKIFCFSNVPQGREGIALAMAEDGCVLAQHWCSSEAFVRYDLGMIEGVRQDRRDAYAKHYPDGYELEFVPANEAANHAGVMAAYALNQQTEETKK